MADVTTCRAGGQKLHPDPARGTEALDKAEKILGIKM